MMHDFDGANMSLMCDGNNGNYYSHEIHGTTRHEWGGQLGETPLPGATANGAGGWQYIKTSSW